MKITGSGDDARNAMVYAIGGTMSILIETSPDGTNFATVKNPINTVISAGAVDFFHILGNVGPYVRATASGYSTGTCVVTLWVRD